MALQENAFQPEDRSRETGEAVDRAVAATEGVRDLLKECNGKGATAMRRAITDSFRIGQA